MKMMKKRTCTEVRVKRPINIVQYVFVVALVIELHTDPPTVHGVLCARINFSRL